MSISTSILINKSVFHCSYLIKTNILFKIAFIWLKLQKARETVMILLVIY